MFLKVGVVIVEYFVYERMFGFPSFCFYYLFVKLFLFKNKKCGEGYKPKFHDYHYQLE